MMSDSIDTIKHEGEQMAVKDSVKTALNRAGSHCGSAGVAMNNPVDFKNFLAAAEVCLKDAAKLYEHLDVPEKATE